MSEPIIVLDENNKPVFIGKEDPNNPPVRPVGEGSKMQCENCGNMVDYLLGSIKRVCEACYDPLRDRPDKKGETYDESKELKV